MARRKDVIRWVKTIAILLAAANAGANLGIFNPTLPDMEKMTSSTTAQMSITLAGIGIGGMIGAVLSGPLFDKFNGLIVLSLTVLAQGLCIGVAPWCPELIGYQIMVALACIFQCAIHAGTMAINCLTWKSKPEMVAPIIQLTDMIMVLGIAMTPQIVRPFIGRIRYLPDTDIHFNTTANSSSVSYFDFSPPNSTLAPPTLQIDRSRIQPIQTAYLIIAIFDVVVSMLCIGVYFLSILAKCNCRDDHRYRRESRRRSQSLNEADLRSFLKAREVAEKRARRRAGSEERVIVSKPTETSGHGESTSAPAFACNALIGALMCILFAFFVVLGARETLFTGLLFTFVNIFLRWQATAGTLLVTSYHVTRVAIHAIIVVVARWVSPMKLTLFNLTLLILSAVLTMFTAAPVFAAGVILSGVATSNFLPTAITLAQASFQVDGKIMGLFVGALACGQCIISPIAGQLMTSFPVIILALTISSCVLFVPWLLIARCALRERRRRPFLFNPSRVPPDDVIIVTARNENNNSHSNNSTNDLRIVPAERTPLLGS